MRAVISANPENATRASEFVLLAKCLAAAKGKAADAQMFAEQFSASDKIQSILKSATPGGLSDPTWAGNLAEYRQLSDAFTDGLRSISAIDKIWSDNAFFRMPLRSRVPVLVLGAMAEVVSEGGTKVIDDMAFVGVELPEQKAVATCVVSNDLVKLAGPSATNAIGTELKRAVAAASNVGFLDALDSAGIPTLASSGPDVDSVWADAAAMFGAMTYGETSRFYLIASPQNLVGLAFLLRQQSAPQFAITGGNSAGVTFIPADAAGDNAYLLDAASIGVDLGPVTLGIATDATVDMSGGDSPAFSLWQKNCVGIRAERYFGCVPLRATAAAKLSNVSWGPAAQSEAVTA